MSKNKLYLFVFLIFLCGNVGKIYSQRRTIDSLLILLKSEKTDTSRISAFSSLSTKYLDISLYDSSKFYARQALLSSNFILSSKENRPGTELWKSAKLGVTAAENNFGAVALYQGEYSASLNHYLNALKMDIELKNRKGIAKRYGNIALVFHLQSDYPKALQYYQKALKLDESLGNKIGIARHLGNMGLIYYDQGEISKALEIYFKTLKIAEELGNKISISTTLGNIGLAYGSLGEQDKSLEYNFKALKIAKEADNKIGIGRDLGNIGNSYRAKKEFSKALKYYADAIKIGEELGDKSNISLWLGNTGGIYFSEKNYSEGLSYFFKALSISKDIGDKNQTAIWLGNIGDAYIDLKNYKVAEKHLQEALILADSIGAIDIQKDQFGYLSKLYKQTGEFKKSLDFYKRYSTVMDSLFNEKKNKELTKHELTYEFDKKESMQKAEQEKKDAVALQEQKRQELFLWLICAIASGILFVAIIIFRSLRTAKKQKMIIENQKQLVEEKQKEILDSIHYAKRIQISLLPTEKYINKNLKRLKL